MSSPPAGLTRYREKRDFSRTREPAGTESQQGEALQYVVQRHAARRLHYDLRLEWRGVMKSWAVTRGPSLDPADKRLAVEVEDHPIDYNSFEGTIPKGQYGGGTVQIWDRGRWAPLDPSTVDEDLAHGELKFVVAGQRLKGGFVLVRMRHRRGESSQRNNWLLIKERDSAATPGAGDAVLNAETSVVSGRTMEEIGAGDEIEAGPEPKPKTRAPKTQAAKTSPRKPEGIPEFVPPQLCEPVDTPPSGAAWVHELKLDGYRLQLRVEGGQAVLLTRTGLDWTGRFPAIAKAAAVLPDCLIDGEAVALDAEGHPSFSLLQATLSGERRAPTVYFAFDLLHDGKRDLRNETLETRKQALRSIIPENHAILRFLDHFSGPGDAVLASACELSMEGIVSKRLEGRYISGRGTGWTKSKCRGRDEFLIGGWTKARSGNGLGALLVGARREGKFVYLGRVGTGFSGRVSEDLLHRLTPLKTAASPFEGRQPAKTSDVIWTTPSVVAEVAYGGWTEAEGVLRHASFLGVREDKPAAEVTPPRMPETAASPVPSPAPSPAGKPAPRPARSVNITHPDRVLWPATTEIRAVTKGDLADYYARYADRILAQIGGRPLSMLRAPEGITGEFFFQRHAMRGQSPLIGSVTIPGQPKPFLRIDDEAGLAALAQISVVELHPWGARGDTPDVPDRLIFDLDPAEGLDFGAVVSAGLDLRARLKGMGLEAFARVTGGKGLHVVVPLSAPKRGDPPGWPEAKQFARLVCAMMEHDAPNHYTTTMAKRARGGKIFLDYLRNDKLATAVAGWSPRGRPGAPVAMPVPWTAVKPGLDPAGWRLPKMLDAKSAADPWADFGAAAGSLQDALVRVTKA